MSFAQMAATLIKHAYRAPRRAPPKKRGLSPKYSALCGLVLAEIKRVVRGNRNDFELDCTKTEFSTATGHLINAGQIAYIGHAPWGYWQPLLEAHQS